MNDDEAHEAPELVRLATPRPLTAEESELLHALVDRTDVDGLRAQARSAQVIGTCSCGCPSVGLSTTAPSVPPDVVRRLGDTGREDWCELSAWGHNPEGRTVQVSLHLIDGRVHELEIWPGWDGGPSATALPIASTLSAAPEP